MAKFGFRNPFTLRDNKQPTQNKYNDALLKLIGNAFTSYDTLGTTYVDKGYNENPIVFSVVSQRANKLASVPFNVKKVKDESQKRLRDSLTTATKYNLTPQQEVKRMLYESKAFEDEYIDLPLERPNPLQTWKEFKELYETFMALNGNAYIYLLSPDTGLQAGEPLAWYLLPSHMTQIILKDNCNFVGTESPVDHYILTEGATYIEFEAENVVHIKYANPNFDLQGSHLYGQAPLKAALKNIQSSNTAFDLNIKTLNSSGAFGFIHGTNIPLTPDQANELKSRLREMDADTSRLGNIKGMSGELKFTQIGLSPDELKLFDFLNLDTKQICNVLGWSDVLLNSDARGDFGGTIHEIKKGVLIDTTLPDLQLFDEAVNSKILPRYNKYKGYVLEHDISELPEMQKDMAEMAKWLNPALDKGAINRKTYNTYFGFPVSDDPNMDLYTVSTDILTLEQAINDYPLNEPPNAQTI